MSVVTTTFATGECYQNGVCYRGVLSQGCLILGSVIRMVFATGECCHIDVCYWRVLSEWCLLPGSVASVTFATGQKQQYTPSMLSRCHHTGWKTHCSLEHDTHDLWGVQAASARYTQHTLNISMRGNFMSARRPNKSRNEWIEWIRNN